MGANFGSGSRVAPSRWGPAVEKDVHWVRLTQAIPWLGPGRLHGTDNLLVAKGLSRRPSAATAPHPHDSRLVLWTVGPGCGTGTGVRQRPTRTAPAAVMWVPQWCWTVRDADLPSQA
ncbi:hypothetical protein EASAB2608_03778 [Streptomyces sp. EAS-AB2608]|nr:hypothetical protein EASAB2608_03778 [Streptomyces sp. EAS-AB2608]